MESNNDDKKDENKEKAVSFAGTKINSDASLKDDESIMGTTLSFLTCREGGKIEVETLKEIAEGKINLADGLKEVKYNRMELS